MQNYKDRYGLSRAEISTLRESWWREKNLNICSGWENFNTFVRWAADTGYVKNALLRRMRADKPYGPDNAFWAYPETGKQEYPDGHPCKGCEQEDGCYRPCDIRLQYWDAGMAKLRGLMEVHGND